MTIKFPSDTPTIIPALADNALVSDTSNGDAPSKSTWQSVFDLFNTGFSSIFSKYSGDADFYQYSIVRTVSGGNLTVALNNYEGNDPTPTKPVKIMIGGVVRTITIATNFSYASG
jgi:hypothetical protein